MNPNSLIKAQFAALLLALSLPSYSATVIEFYNANLDNYFITADVAEATAIDGGAAGAGWVRTGYDFESGDGTTPVCRFYGSYDIGPNSHFYTADAGECGYLKQLQAATADTEQRWNYEDIAFSSTLPVNQTCPENSTPIYRAYNNGSARGIDSNHRITNSLTAIREVVAKGWSDEGVVMCANSSATLGPAYQITEKFDSSLAGTNMVDVMGLTNYTPNSYGQYCVAVPVKFGEIINAATIMQKAQGSIYPNAQYKFDVGMSNSFQQLSTSSYESFLAFDGARSNAITVFGSQLNRVTFGAGNHLNTFSLNTILFGADTNNENIFRYLTRWIRDFYVDSTPYTATAEEIVNAANAFGVAFTGRLATIGCEEIVNQISYAAGAGMPPPLEYLKRPISPADVGRWKVIYNSNAHLDTNWPARLNPGDIVYYLHQGGGDLAFHMFVVAAVSAQGIETVDNGGGTIGRHFYSNAKLTTDPDQNAIAVWRFDSNYPATSDRILNWFESQFSGLLANATTQEVNGYSMRLYSNGYAVGIKDNHIFVLDPITSTAYDLGNNDFLATASMFAF